jgi:hypothetical protein
MESNWITSSGFKQASFQFKRPKLKKGFNVITRSATRSLQGSTSTTYKSLLYFEHDFELLDA